MYLGQLARYESNLAKASDLLKNALLLAHEQEWDFIWLIRFALTSLGYVALQEHDYDMAMSYFRQALSHAQGAAEKSLLVLCLTGLALIAETGGQMERALRLGGAAAALLPATKAKLWPREYSHSEQFLADLRSRAGGTALAALWDEGENMPLIEVVALALAAPTAPEPGHMPVQQPLLTPTPPTSPARRDPDALTAREVEVLRLVAVGLTDAEIATHLVLSPRTVQVHLRSIYGKLGLTTRSAATRYAIEHQLA
jgi:DNA-binding CsgD family transcriptional regulator